MTSELAYQPKRVSRSEEIAVRGLRYHVRLWGERSLPPLVMLHGSRDMSATYQFVIDHFQRDYFIVAPDWRGHGRSDQNTQGYWFQDYLGDLDAVLDHYFAGQAVPLVGHSLGGNVAGVYAGVRPERIEKLICLDGFGLLEEPVEETPDFLCAWLDGWRDFRGESKAYGSTAEMAARLMKANARLSADKAAFLAIHMSKSTPQGFVWSFDARHRLPFAIRHRRAEWAACVKRTKAPTLWVSSDRVSRLEKEPGGLEARRALIHDMSYTKVPDTSHNLHHDNPARVAALIEDFLEGRRP